MFESLKEVVKTYKKQILIALLVSIGLTIIDQFSKWMAMEFLGPLTSELPEGQDLPNQFGNSIEVIPGLLNFTLLTNNGAAFKLGHGTIWARVIFIIVSWAVFLGVPIYLLYYYKKNNKKVNILYFICLILIYGGNLGNLIDRTFYWGIPCGVIDFIDISPLIPNFGVFNFADSCVVVGVIVLLISLIIDIFKGEDKKEKDELKEIKEDNKETSDQTIENNDNNQENNIEDGKEVHN